MEGSLTESRMVDEAASGIGVEEEDISRLLLLHVVGEAAMMMMVMMICSVVVVAEVVVEAITIVGPAPQEVAMMIG